MEHVNGIHKKVFCDLKQDKSIKLTTGITAGIYHFCFNFRRIYIPLVNDCWYKTQNMATEVGECNDGHVTMNAKVAEESVDGFPLTRRRRTFSTSSVDSLDSTLTKLIPMYVWKVVSFESLPVWLKDNKYVRHGYRPPTQSFSKCFGSMFRIHTETMNIWTHIFGVVMFCILALYVYTSGMSKISLLPWYEQVIIGMFFLSAITCLSLSSLFHTVNNHSEDIALLFCRMDYSGITVLITGSCIPCYYYSFYCATFSRYLHIGVTFILCALCLLFCLLKRFTNPKFRVVRAVMFIAFGFYGFVPAIQVLSQVGFAYAEAAYSLSGLIKMASVYVSGAGLYISRIPERFFPGRFDIWASSHQLFHVCVLVAAYLHYGVIVNMVSYRLSIGLENCLPVVL